jgi:hypothetical protein
MSRPKANVANAKMKTISMIGRKAFEANRVSTRFTALNGGISGSLSVRNRKDKIHINKESTIHRVKKTNSPRPLLSMPGSPQPINKSKELDLAVILPKEGITEVVTPDGESRNV